MRYGSDEHIDDGTIALCALAVLAEAQASVRGKDMAREVLALARENLEREKERAAKAREYAAKNQAQRDASGK